MDLLVFITLLPSYLLGKYVYNMDRIEKEPKGLLIKLFIAGIGAILLTLILSDVSKLLFPILESNDTDIKTLFIYNYFGVGLIEEFSKWIFLLLCTWKNKNFNFLFDGIVYAVFISLGFATVENCLYVFFGGGISTALLRAVLSVPGHVFFGVFMGYYYGLARMNKNLKKSTLFYLIMSFILPVFLHGTFDFCLAVDSLMFVAIYAIFVIILYIISFKKIKQMSKNDKYIN